MKIIIIVFSTFFCTYQLFAIPKEEKDSVRMSKWKYFESYSKDQEKKELIYDYWVQYFSKDIYGHLTQESTDDYHCLFFDSYGGIMPNLSLFDNCSLDDFNQIYGFLKGSRLRLPNLLKTNKKVNDKSLIKYSIYQIIYNNLDDCAPCLNRFLNEESYSTAKKVLDDQKNDDRSAFDNNTIGNFYEKWDEIRISEETEILRVKMKEKKNIVFFFHGYNVPYSLAVIQGKVLIDQLCEFNLNRSETLFIPVFWSSNDQKEINIETQQNFSTDNDQKFFKGGLKNGTNFLYYSNRAYFTALKLRILLKRLEGDFEDKNVYMIAHSLGTIIPTTLFINNKEKLDLDWKEKKQPEKLNWINSEIVKLMENEIPRIKTSIFLSAPSMPGVTTFSSIDKEIFEHIKVFSTVNKQDIMLTKNVSKVVKKLLKKRAGTMNASSLGMCTCEALLVKQIFDSRGISNSFTFKVVSNQWDHEIFSYLQQEGYISFFEEFAHSAETN